MDATDRVQLRLCRRSEYSYIFVVEVSPYRISGSCFSGRGVAECQAASAVVRIKADSGVHCLVRFILTLH